MTIIQVLNAGLHKYAPCAGAKFADNSLVKVSRAKHLADLPALGAVVACIPAGTPPEYVWADYRGVPRPLMISAPSRVTRYLIAFEDRDAPVIIKERFLRQTDGEANINFAREQ
jgi:hypothetical protein